ncbi:hypothetical protein IZU99_05450 [Oscillospiraceae bacterium CM]|nr:hypothetical protein IZU99_05450 [Oscillospiraceae bacterium CM]
MDNNTNIFIAAPPEFIESAGRSGLTVAHMIYRIGRGYRLYRAQGAEVKNGGVMVLDTDGFTGGGPVSELVAEILTECARHNFTGIVLETGDKAPPAAASLAVRLSAAAAEQSLTLYIQEALAPACPTGVVLIQSALSGGRLSDHLGDAVTRYGAHRVALEIERVKMDFLVPAVTGAGRALAPGEFEALLAEYKPQTFLSNDLCANYFTYRNKKGTHFVLFDTAASIRRKLAVAQRLGITTAFLYYPHVSDLLGKILEP